jgi:hypothetical protein
MGANRNAYKIFMGKPEDNRPLGRHRCRWEDNIKMDFREIGWGGMDWTDLAQDRDQWRAFVSMIMNVWVLQNVGRVTGSFSRRAQLHVVSYSGE